MKLTQNVSIILLAAVAASLLVCPGSA